jgi:transposase-like protein
MTKNSIQFQTGLSLPRFLESYGTEQQCRDALFKLRWPTGFVCPACGNTTYCELHGRKVYQCNHCHTQTSLTSGTIFASTKLPLTQWFLSIYLLTQHKSSISALQLMREIGVSYNTAWKIKHKLMQVMLERQRGDTLSGRIEIDDAYIGGERPENQDAAPITRRRSSRWSKPTPKHVSRSVSNCAWSRGFEVPRLSAMPKPI